jgi:hypothetical protein
VLAAREFQEEVVKVSVRVSAGGQVRGALVVLEKMVAEALTLEVPRQRV